jgi:hypothetical protein
MSSSSEQWSKSMSGEMLLQFAIVCKGLLRLKCRQQQTFELI